MNKQKLIADYLAKPYEVGESVYIQGLGSQNKNAWFNGAEIIDIDETGVFINEHSRKTHYTFDKVKKNTNHIGYFPFPIQEDYTRNVNFQLSSILFKMGFGRDTGRIDDYKNHKGSLIPKVDFNPYVTINGEKKYYQRPLVWKRRDKQLLIESIYNDITCGKILVRLNSYQTCFNSEDKAFVDVVDGKQRINAVVQFMNNEYCDLNGMYFKDFNALAQAKFNDHQLFSYAEIPETAPDEFILKQFLKVNFSGVQQSKQHLEYVKSLL